MSWERATRAALLALYVPLAVSLALSVFISGMALRDGAGAALLGVVQLALLYAVWRRASAIWEGAAKRRWLDAAAASAFILAVLRWGRP